MNKSTTTTPLKGYKKTTIGIIPENWEVMKLGDLGETFSGLSGKNKDDFGKGYPYIPYKNIFQNSKIDINYMDFVNVKENEKQHQVKYGDIFFTTSSETAIEVGMSSVLLEEVETMYLNSFCFGFRLKNYETLNPLFSSYLLRGEQIRKELTVLAQGSTRFNLSKSELLKLLIPIPPLPEQQKIAEILSTWDEAITNCKTTINTLKDRNKGLAQQLLTGKKRLSGFSEKWEELKADKIFRNNTDKTHNGELEILSATQERGVIPRSMNNIDIKYDANSLGTYKKVEVGDYVISLRSFQGGIEYSEYEGIVSPAYTILKEIIPISKTFFKVYFKTETFISRLNTIIYGIRDGKQISFKDFATLKLPCPSVDEQNAIAEVLEIADQELKSYETKLEALQLQKKGLMQQLLTGKIRVNVK